MANALEFVESARGGLGCRCGGGGSSGGADVTGSVDGMALAPGTVSVDEVSGCFSAADDATGGASTVSETTATFSAFSVSATDCPLFTCDELFASAAGVPFEVA